MKNNVRSKISGFLKSEEGRVGVKSPLAMGVASAGLLLAQAMVTPSVQADEACDFEDPEACGESMVCKRWCVREDLGTCIEWEAHCDWG